MKEKTFELFTVKDSVDTEVTVVFTFQLTNNVIAMADTKILQALLGGQVQIRDDLKRVEKKVEENGTRIDKLGMQIASLEDDAPTISEFDGLEKRVEKLEKQFVSA